jgi:hypothetical protein
MNHARSQSVVGVKPTLEAGKGFLQERVERRPRSIYNIACPSYSSPSIEHPW